MKLKTLAKTAALCLFASIPELYAQDFPVQQINVITHSGAGGGTDITTRMMMLRARRELGVEMNVVNIQGRDGGAAMDHFLTVPTDGHTILAFTAGHAAAVAKGATKMTLDHIRPLVRATEDPQILMTRCQDFKDAASFIEAQRAEALVYGTSGFGNIDDVSAFRFAQMGNLQNPALKAYEGGAEIVKSMLSQDIDVAVLNLAEAGEQIQAGEICPMVVLADSRIAALPDTPTAKELGIDVSLSTVRGFVVHKNTPDDVANQLEAALLRSMQHGVYQNFLNFVGLNSTSIAASDEWGPQIHDMVRDMQVALTEMGYIE